MSEDRGRRAKRPDRAQRPMVVVNDNDPANGHALTEVSGLLVSEITPVAPVAANDNQRSIVLSAANDNDPLVIDDLLRPLPVMEGEGELFRQLFGDRFRQLLMEEGQ